MDSTRTDERGLTPAWAWTVVAGGAGGLAATYWDDGWHTAQGRDSAFIPPHLLLYTSMGVVGAVLAVWVLTTFGRSRSVPALFATPGLLLAVAAGIATAGAAPVDAAWHTAFGRDAVLWSPPHLVSVLATAVLVIAVLLGLQDRGSRALRAALGTVLLGAGQLVVLEYDTDVPQFSESLYLPLIVLLGLGAAWIAGSVSGTRAGFRRSVAAYLALRLLLLVVLGAAGWIAPDLPIALLGLVLLELPRRHGAARWPLAALAMTALQLLASALGISSVALEPTILAAAIVVPLLAVVLVIMWTRNRATQATALLIVLAAASAQFAPAARAHDPGQGPEVTTAEMSVLPGENGAMTIHIGRFADGTGSDVQPTRVLARRAGKTTAGPLRREGDGFAGALDPPSGGLWLVYGELRVDDRPVEIWLPVSSDGPVVTEVRPVYMPAGASARPAGEYLAGAALLVTGFGLVGWAAVAVRRTARR